MVSGAGTSFANAESVPISGCSAKSERMSSAVITERYNDFRNETQYTFPDCVIYADATAGQPSVVLTTVELLARLTDKGVKNAEIARALGVTPSRVTEMFKGDRAIKLDEAVKLVEAFGLESPPSQKAPALPVPVARLIVLYIAAELGVTDPNRHQVQALAEDVRAFAEFVNDPVARGSIEAAEVFFQAMRLRRPAASQEADPQGTDPQSTR